MAGPRQIFISYSQSDKDVALVICSALEARDLICWIAPRDVVPGSEWSDSITSAIDGCSAMIVVISHTSNSSRHVKSEIRAAFDKKKRIVPVTIDGVLFGPKLEYFLGNSHAISMHAEGVEAAADQLAKAVSDGASQENDHTAMGSRTPAARAAPTGRRRPASTLVSIVALLVLILAGGGLWYHQVTSDQLVGARFEGIVHSQRGDQREAPRVTLILTVSGTMVRGDYENTAGDRGSLVGTLTGSALDLKLLSETMPGSCVMKGSLTEKHRKISAVYSCDDGEHASVELNRVEKPAKGRVKPELDEIDRIDENIRKGIEELKAK